MVETIKELFNAASSPETVFFGSLILLLLALRYYRTWTKPKYAIIPPILYLAFMAFAVQDPNFGELVQEPDNVPILLLQVFLYFFLWLSLRQAAINDERIENGKPPIEKTEAETKIFTWPDLVYVEFLTAIIILVLLIVWSILIPAPLEEPANPTHAPNPSKAPWYFLGLQEMLVYFDPWIAGVVLPTLIIVGLMAIPYIDKNPKGKGYYTLKQRPFAITMFLVGFVVFWMVYIQMGTFLRGPNWNFFGPFEQWTVDKSPALTNIDLSEIFWLKMLGYEVMPKDWYIREAPGIALVLFYFIGMPPILLAVVPFFRKLFREMGFLRWSLFIFLFLTMMSIPIKQILRWTINLKYIVHIDEFFFNI